MIKIIMFQSDLSEAANLRSRDLREQSACVADIIPRGLPGLHRREERSNIARGSPGALAPLRDLRWSICAVVQ
jgi:hypothetical protein